MFFFVFFTKAMKNIHFYKTLREHLKCGDVYTFFLNFYKYFKIHFSGKDSICRYAHGMKSAFPNSIVQFALPSQHAS
jgi:hypothetical protein